MSARRTSCAPAERLSSGKDVGQALFHERASDETYEDIEGIAALAKKVDHEFYTVPGRVKGKAPMITISVSCFVPKPFTAFQWEGQDTLEELVDKQNHLRDCVRGEKHIRYNWHEAKVSRIEAVFAAETENSQGHCLKRTEWD